MTDGTPDPQAHEKAKAIDPAAARQVLADPDEDAGSDHSPTAG